MPKTDDVKWGLHILEIEITTRCNLNCSHCYNRTLATLDMPLAEIISLIKLAEQKKVQRVIISGGEAVMHPEFKALAQYLKENKPSVQIVIQSNGLIDTIDLELVRAFDIVHLSFEPDGSEVRKSSASKTIAAAKKFLDAGIYTYFFATVHPGNIDQIDWMTDIANENKIDIGFNLCIANHRQHLQLSAEQKKSTIKKLHQLYLDKKTLRFTSPFAAILKNQSSDQYLGIKGGCTAGVAACVVLANGDIIPCPFFRIKVGNIHETDLETIWFQAQILQEIRQRQKFDQPCGHCPYLSFCGGCRARAYTETGRLQGFDPDCPLHS